MPITLFARERCNDNDITIYVPVFTFLWLLKPGRGFGRSSVAIKGLTDGHNATGPIRDSNLDP